MEKVITDFGYVNLVTDWNFSDEVDEDGQPEEEEYVRLDYVEVSKEHQGKGHATNLILKAIEAAKLHNLPIYIVAHKYPDSPLPLKNLVALYEKCGFSITENLGNIIMKY